MADDDKRPIIIKKIKKGGHGHHGGAWKVAYADFVTAMMAFFLLLWLISSVDEAKLQGLAEYFTPTTGIKDSMGIGFEGGMTANDDGVKKSDRSPPGIIVGVEQSGVAEDKKDSPIESDKDSQLFEQAEDDIKKAFEADPNLRDLADNVIVEQTPEGLKIEIMDSDKYPMFDPGSVILTEFGRRMMAKMAALIKDMPNFISITGHTDASVMTSRGATYSNWELSADRANAARRQLLRSGMEPERPKKVVGKAATELLLPEQPKSPRNRRITIILLRGDYLNLQPSELPATRDILSVPAPGQKKSDALREQRRKEKRDAREAQKTRPLAPQIAPVLIPGGGEITPADPSAPKPIDALSTPLIRTAPATPVPAVGLTDTPVPAPIRERTDEDFEAFIDE